MRAWRRTAGISTENPAVGDMADRGLRGRTAAGVRFPPSAAAGTAVGRPPGSAPAAARTGPPGEPVTAGAPAGPAAALAAEASAGYPAARSAVLLELLRAAAGSPEAADRDTAARVLCGLPARTLVRLDAAARPVATAGPFGGGPKARRALLREGHTAVLALLAMDENGGIREEAVVRLAACPGQLAAAILALRTDDWAEPVRRRARIAVMWRLDPDEAAAVVPVLEARARKSRAAGIAGVYRDAYRSAHLPSRYHGRARELAASPAPPLRRFGHELARGLGLSDEKALLRTALHDPDHACRAAAGHELLDQARGRHRDRTALALLRADDAAVRERAVAALPPARDPAALAAALADRSAAVRAAARERLAAGGTDAAAAYRELLDLPPARGLVPGLLIGLGECGEEDDLDHLHARFDAEEPAYRRAARAGAVALTRAWLPEQR